MKTDDNSAAAASDPKRRGDGLGSNAFDLATVLCFARIKSAFEMNNIQRRM
jgi:hypothetical protein